MVKDLKKKVLNILISQSLSLIITCESNQLTEVQ